MYFYISENYPKLLGGMHPMSLQGHSASMYVERPDLDSQPGDHEVQFQGFKAE